MKSIKHDDGKLEYHLVKPEMIEEIAKVLTFGKKKYSEDNWLELPDAEKRYYSAAMRHIEARRKGEVFDKESGLRHISHAITCLEFMLYKEIKDEEAKNK